MPTRVPAAAAFPPPLPSPPSHRSTRTIYDVILPGTHDSAAYAARPELLSRLHILPLRMSPIRRLVSSVQVDFALTQTLSILEQLRAGARFLDIRVSKRPPSTADHAFWTVHGMVILVPLAEVLHQINRFHAETGGRNVVVTVFRAQQLDEAEQQALSVFILATLNHGKYLDTPEKLRHIPLVQLPPNIIAGINASKLPISWGRDAWLDTYDVSRKTSFLRRTLRTSAHRELRDALLVLGWTVTPQTSDITARVLSMGLARPGVRAEARRMNERFERFVKEHEEELVGKVNVVFFDCFGERQARLVGRINADAASESDESVVV